MVCRSELPSVPRSVLLLESMLMSMPPLAPALTLALALALAAVAALVLAAPVPAVRSVHPSARQWVLR